MCPQAPHLRQHRSRPRHLLEVLRSHYVMVAQDEGQPLPYFSFSIGFTSTPTPSMSISQVSPCFIHTGLGLRAWPTPEGVPVKTMSPGSSVIPWGTWAMVSAPGNIMLWVLSDCMPCPLSRVWIFKALAPAGSSSAVTIHGQKPPVRSKFLPMSHCVVLR